MMVSAVLVLVVLSEIPKYYSARIPQCVLTLKETPLAKPTQEATQTLEG